MTVRTFYENPARALQLGTIIRRADDYLLCVQPLCDSVRLPSDSDTFFPFLVLEKPEPEKGARFVIFDGDTGAFVRLATQAKPNCLTTARFRADATGHVTAGLQGDGFAFTDAEEATYRWICELKPEVGRDLAVTLAEQFARQGVDEPEIPRLSRR
jgi:hypothetical protein